MTGVVNFILKDDFEGVDINFRGGVSGENDAENFAFDALFGQNFANGRGNIVLAVSIEDDTGLTYGERDWSRDNGIDTVQTNPAFLTDPNAPTRAIVSDPRFWLTSQEGSIRALADAVRFTSISTRMASPTVRNHAAAR